MWRNDGTLDEPRFVSETLEPRSEIGLASHWVTRTALRSYLFVEPVALVKDAAANRHIWPPDAGGSDRPLLLISVRQRVCDSLRDPVEQPCLRLSLPLRNDGPGEDIVFDVLQQSREDGGESAACRDCVVVSEDDEFSVPMFKTLVEGPVLSPLGYVQISQRKPIGEGLQNLCGPIGATVVDDDHLPATLGIVEGRMSVECGRERSLTVEC